MILLGIEKNRRSKLLKGIMIDSKKLKKACFIASSGGHWEELMCLKEIADAYDTFYVTEEGGQSKDLILNRLYTLTQINRHEKNFFMHFVKLMNNARKILKKEKPHFIVTTGALIAFPFCFFAKINRIKIVYIESFARVNTPSITGKLVYPFADLFLVQWKPLLKFYPKAKYVGGIF